MGDNVSGFDFSNAMGTGFADNFGGTLQVAATPCPGGASCASGRACAMCAANPQVGTCPPEANGAAFTP